MKKTGTTLLALAMVLTVPLLVSAPVLAGEETVTFTSSGQKVVGTLSVPDGEPSPVVLLLHGFGGSRDELKTEHVPKGIFGRTAARLAENGYASLRIDFRGSGESVGDIGFAETTFEGQVSDALAAIDYLQTSDRVEGDKLFLVGWSQGGIIATAAAGRTDTFEAVALWAAPSDPATTFGDFLGAGVIAAGLAAGPDEAVDVPLPNGTEIEMNGAFFKGVTAFDSTAEIAAYPGPLLVAQGTKDTIVAPASADALIAAHDGPEERFSAPMDHVFDTFRTDTTLEELIGATIAFFRANDD